MRRIKRPLHSLMAIMLLAAGVSQIAVADAANAPSLVISQLKISSSNGQFITLYNATNTTLDLGKYQLEYFNNYDLTKATSSKLISLNGSLPPHGYLLVNDSSQLLCYQLTVDSVSLGLSSTAGMIEVLAYNQSGPGGSVTTLLQDFVGWSKTAASGAQTLPSNTSAFLERLPVDAANNPLISVAGSGSWQAVQPDSNNVCNLVVVGTPTAAQTGLSELLPATEPLATIGGSLEDVPSGVPAGDASLMKPLITEILPNPAGSGNDAVDEFIEIYNPNVTSFDASGFSLQTGTTSVHSFTFAEGTILPAQSFTTFYARVTHLSMSNSGGQVKLLDPTGNLVTATAAYGSAKDGQAWALANGKWYWTTDPTPGAPNVIVQPVKATKTTTKKPAAAKAKKAKAAKTKKTKIKTTAKTANATIPSSSPIHSSTLAVLFCIALLYGTYEYRTDLANFFHKLKRNFKFGSGRGS